MLITLKKYIQPLIDFLIIPIQWIHPNVLSIMSLFISVPGFYFLSQGKGLLGSIFVLGAIFDTFDGAVARKTGKTTQFGKILDATLDRVYDGLVLLFMALGGLVDSSLAIILLTLSVSISYIKAKAEALLNMQEVGTNKFSVGLMNRGERIFFLFILAILSDYLEQGFIDLIMWILIAFAIITLIWRGIVIYKEVEK